MSDTDLSLIIPCYNEGPTLRDNLYQILDVLNFVRLRYEIIFIDDCSIDGTMEFIKRIASEISQTAIKMIFHRQNEGRGSTVREGILNSKAKIVGFLDIDLSTPARYIPALVMEINKGADIATALRVYKLNWSTFPRMILSKGYKFLLRLLLNLDLNDTETGFKFFNRERILPILNEVKDRHWFWDTEIMVRSYLKGLKIIEVPSVFIRKGFYTRVKIIKDSMRHLVKLIKLRQELKMKHLI